MITTRTLATTAALAVLCAAALTAPPAAAQAPQRDRAGAEALFEAGRELMEKGQFKAACQKFEASQRADPAVGTVLNLANCYEKTGRLASAWERFQDAAQQLPPGDDRLPVATSRAAALKPRLPRLELTLDPEAPNGTQVLRDDVVMAPGALGVALPIDPGSHRIVVKAPGHEDAEVQIDLAEGKLVKRRLSLGAISATAPTPEAPAAPASQEVSWWTGQRTAGVVTGSVGVVGLAVGLGLGGVAIAQKNTISQNCTVSSHMCATPAELTAATNAASTGRTVSTASTVSFVIGAAALAGGVVLIIVGAPSQGPAKDAAPPASPSASLRGTVLPGGGALTVSGSF
jgi:hypothetical protein